MVGLYFDLFLYNVVQIWPGLIVCNQDAISPGHIWTTLYHGDKIDFLFFKSLLRSDAR